MSLSSLISSHQIQGESDISEDDWIVTKTKFLEHLPIYRNLWLRIVQDDPSTESSEGSLENQDRFMVQNVKISRTSIETVSTISCDCDGMTCMSTSKSFVPQEFLQMSDEESSNKKENCKAFSNAVDAIYMDCTSYQSRSPTSYTTALDAICENNFNGKDQSKENANIIDLQKCNNSTEIFDSDAENHPISGTVPINEMLETKGMFTGKDQKNIVLDSSVLSNSNMKRDLNITSRSKKLNIDIDDNNLEAIYIENNNLGRKSFEKNNSSSNDHLGSNAADCETDESISSNGGSTIVNFNHISFYQEKSSPIHEKVVPNLGIENTSSTENNSGSNTKVSYRKSNAESIISIASSNKPEVRLHNETDFKKNNVVTIKDKYANDGHVASQRKMTLITTRESSIGTHDSNSKSKKIKKNRRGNSFVSTCISPRFADDIDDDANSTSTDTLEWQKERVKSNYVDISSTSEEAEWDDQNKSLFEDIDQTDKFQNNKNDNKQGNRVAINIDCNETNNQSDLESYEIPSTEYSIDNDVSDESDVDDDKSAQDFRPSQRLRKKKIIMSSSKERTTFRKMRDNLSAKTLQEFDSKVFGGALTTKKILEGIPPVTVTWSNKLRTTAGITRLQRKRSTNEIGEEPVRTASIELSMKVIDSETRLRTTLLHELCHAAAWIIDNNSKPPHGKCFKKWAKKGMKFIPDVEVTTTHEYIIAYKYAWACSNSTCNVIIKRHSRSIDTDRQVCGKCRGKLVEIEVPSISSSTTNTSTKDIIKIREKAPPSAYNIFIKNNSKGVKSRLERENTQDNNNNNSKKVSQSDVMKECARLWKEKNRQEN